MVSHGIKEISPHSARSGRREIDEATHGRRRHRWRRCQRSPLPPPPPLFVLLLLPLPLLLHKRRQQERKSQKKARDARDPIGSRRKGPAAPEVHVDVGRRRYEGSNHTDKNASTHTHTHTHHASHVVLVSDVLARFSEATQTMCARRRSNLRLGRCIWWGGRRPPAGCRLRSSARDRNGRHADLEGGVTTTEASLQVSWEEATINAKTVHSSDGFSSRQFGTSRALAGATHTLKQPHISCGMKQISPHSARRRRTG